MGDNIEESEGPTRKHEKVNFQSDDDDDDDDDEDEDASYASQEEDGR
jgi:hypothetical protein